MKNKWIFLSAVLLLSSFYFYFQNAMKFSTIVLKSKPIYFGSALAPLIGWIQWIFVVNRFENKNNKKVFIWLSILTFMLFLLCGVFLFLYKNFQEKWWLLKLSNVFYGVIRFYATGLIAVISIFLVKYKNIVFG